MNIHRLPPEVLHIRVELQQPQHCNAIFPGQAPYEALDEAIDVLAAWCDAVAAACAAANLAGSCRWTPQRMKSQWLNSPDSTSKSTR